MTGNDYLKNKYKSCNRRQKLHGFGFMASMYSDDASNTGGLEDKIILLNTSFVFRNGDVLLHFHRIEMFDSKNDAFYASEIIIAVRLLHRKKTSIAI